MTDGFYTNDERDEGCFGGYGSDGAWAYADDSASGFGATAFASGSFADAGAFGARASTEPARRRFSSVFRSGGSGGYGRAA